MTQNQAEYHLRQIAESLPGIVYSYVREPDGRCYFSYISGRVMDFYGIDPSDAYADSYALFELVHPDDIERVNHSIEHSYEALCEWVCDYRILANGKAAWLRGIARPEKGLDGKVTWHGVVINVDDQKTVEAELKRLSLTDELTGAFNRRHMRRKLDECAAASQRYGSSFSLISMDIDHFKRINDTYGHPVGDAVLKEFAAMVSDRVRKTDVLARTGGEEFLILAPLTSSQDASHLAEELRQVTERHVFQAEDGHDIRLTVSAGIATSTGAGRSVNDMLSSCDECLYRAKREGRNQVVVEALD